MNALPRRVLLCSFLVASACSVSLDVPEGAVIACNADAECPEGYVCSTGVCEQVLVNVAPTVALRATARGTGTLPLELTVADANGVPDRPDVASIELVAVIDGVRCPMTTLSPALAGLTATRAGVVVATTWNAVADAASCGLTVRGVDRDGDGTADEQSLPRFASVVVEATASDAAGARGAVGSATVELGNDAPTSAIADLPPRVSGDVAIPFTIADTSVDLSSIDLEFALPGEPRDWRPATVKYGATQDIVSDGSGQLLVWDSASASGGVGAFRLDDVALRLRARDDVDGPDYGSFDEVRVAVDNQTPPVVESLQLVGDAFGRATSVAHLTYRLVDEQSDTADLRVEVSIGGAPFTACTELPTEFHHGRLDLASAPRATDGGGVAHVFVWDVAADLGSRGTSNVVLRLTAADLRGGIGPATLLDVGARAGLPATYRGASGYGVVSATNGTVQGRIFVGQTDSGVALDAVTASTGTSPSLLRFAGLTTASLPDGRFAAPAGTSTAVDGILRAQALGNLDNDAFADHVEVGSDVLVISHGGAAGFTADPSIALPSCEPHGDKLAIGDFNGDGQNEVAIGCDTNVRLAQRGGSWTIPATTYPAGNDVARLAAGDVNGDGRDDLVVAAARSGVLDDFFDLVWFPGNATTMLGPPQTIATLLPMVYTDDIRFNEQGLDIVVRDLDGDDLAEIIVATAPFPVAGQVRVYPGGATPGAPLLSEVFQERPGHMSIGDVDGDGGLDLVTFACLRNQAPCVFAHALSAGRIRLTASAYLPATCASPAASAGDVADLDGDGIAELVVRQSCATPTLVTYAWSRGHYPSPVDDVTTVAPITAGTDDIAIADYDHDGVFDLMSSERSTTSFVVQRGSHDSPTVAGNLSIVNAGITMDLLGATTSFLDTRFGDVNGDSLIDVFSTDGSTNATVVQLATFDGASYGRDDVFPSLTGGSLDSLLAIADVNRDGYDDVIGTDGNTFLVHRSNHTGVWSNSFTATPVALGAEATHVAIGDLDGDGDLDLAVAADGTSTNELRVLFNNGSGVFTVDAGCNRSFTGTALRGVAIADLSDDGYPDVVVAVHVDDTTPQYTELRVMALSASLCAGESFTAQTTVRGPVLTFPTSLDAADFNADGIADIYAVSPGNVVVWPVRQVAGLAAGFATPPQSLSTAFTRAEVVDFDRDGVIDIIGVDAGNDVLLAHGAQEGFGAPREIALSSTTLRGVTLSRTTDAFGAPYVPHALLRAYDGLGRWDEPVIVDFRETARLAGVIAAGARPLTRAYEAGGLVRLVADDVSARHRVVDAISGLDATANRGVIFDLPIPLGRQGLDLSSGVVVAFRGDDFLRASDLATDPLFGTPAGADVTPLDPSRATPVLRHVSGWEVVPRDANGDLADGTGRRFIVENTGSTHRVRVLLDVPGVVQAFLQ